jgi:hypothetical protein
MFRIMVAQGTDNAQQALLSSGTEYAGRQDVVIYRHFQKICLFRRVPSDLNFTFFQYRML